MGDLFLVLILTGVICGGVPLLAFSYMNGKLRVPDRGSDGRKHAARRSASKVLLSVALILGIFFGCFTFPVFNLTREVTREIRWINLLLVGFAYYEIASLSATAIPLKKGSILKSLTLLFAFHCIHVLAGMGCRYLLEFGEVSNTYNFTAPNIALHLTVVVGFCLMCCLLSPGSTIVPKAQGDIPA